MKALSSLLLVLSICVATIIPSSAADDKQLKNTRGDVTYQQGTGAPKPVAVNATVSLSNNDFALTGANSGAMITLPDSSQVLIGQNTKIQMLAFDQQPGLATANFFLYQGKTRFAVKHPGGAKANYTFQTSTGQIAVRGTEGDISLDASTLQVNVYALGDPNLPVEVSLNNGKKYELHAGQALVVGVTGAVIAAAAVSSLSSSMTSTFAEFGPANAGAGAAGGAAGAGAAGAAAGVAPAAVAAGAAAVAGAAVVAGATHNSPAPSHTPKPTPSPTTKPTASPTPPSTPTPSPAPGAVTLVQGLKTFTQAGQSQTLIVHQDNNNGVGYKITGLTGTAVSIPPTSTNGSFQVISTDTGGTGSFTVNGAAGGSPLLVNVTARGTTIQLTPLQTFTANKPSQTATASEYGYNKAFNITPPGFIGVSGTSPNFTLNANPPGGTGSLTVTDDGTGTPLTVDVRAALGIQVSSKNAISAVVGGATGSVTAGEKGATITATSGDKKTFTVSPSSGQANATTLFTVTGVSNGSATLTLADGINDPVLITVNVTTPEPTTTCIPIIIHARQAGGHGGHGTRADATPCPSPTPTAVVPHATSAPHPGLHPVGTMPGGPPAKKPVKTEPKHQPGNPMHPMQPLTGPQGAVTPPPLPIPPGGGSPP